MESCRRLNASPLRGDSRNADQPKSGSITSVESGPYLSNQRGTRLSTESTLSQPSTSRSSVSSAEAGKACSFVKNERLNTAVQTNKVENVKSIIRHGGNEVWHPCTLLHNPVRGKMLPRCAIQPIKPALILNFAGVAQSNCLDLFVSIQEDIDRRTPLIYECRHTRI